MITIYGCLRSRALRPIWLLREMGATYDLVPVIQAYRLADPKASDAPFNTADPRFLAINPMGQVPAMTDGALALSDSVAISLYLARKLGGPLAPADLAEEGACLQWALLGISEVETPALAILMAHHQGDPASAEGQAAIATAKTRLARPLARIEAHLQDRDWLVGGRFTVADILLVECVRFALDEPGFLRAYPALWRWLTTARERPVFRALWEARNAEPL
jgi:glutathione S-transferase